MTRDKLTQRGIFIKAKTFRAQSNSFRLLSQINKAHLTSKFKRIFDYVRTFNMITLEMLIIGLRNRRVNSSKQYNIIKNLKTNKKTLEVKST